MARAVQFLSITPMGPADPCGLEPAPSVRDWEEISKGLEGAPDLTNVDELREGTHTIRGDYRSWSMYLYPGVRISRDDPQTTGGHGFAGWPPIGMKEQETLRMNGQKYAAQIEFV